MQNINTTVRGIFRLILTLISDYALFDQAIMYGFAKSLNGSFWISNRIFEAILYNYFITASQIQNANRKHI